MSVFTNHGIFVLPSGLGKARLELFRRRILEKGGQFFEDLDALLSSRAPEGSRMVVVDEAFAFETIFKMLKLAKRGYTLKEAPKGFRLVTSKWLSECLREDRVVDYLPYAVIGAPVAVEAASSAILGGVASSPLRKRANEGDFGTDEASPSKSIKKDTLSSSSEIACGGMRVYGDRDNHDTPRKGVKDEGRNTVHEEGDDDNDADHIDDNSDATLATSANSDVKPISALPPGNWLCARASASRDEPKANPNSFVIEQLERLCQVYKTTNDQWRRLGYQKAISALKRSSIEVKTYDQAVAIPGVGSSIAEKIVEIVESGRLRKLESLGNDGKIRCMDLFQKVWGVGPSYAETFYNQGCRTLDDLRSKAQLTRQQQIGLKHFDDFSCRMSWNEADEIKTFIEKVTLEIQPGLLVEGCGSYRRKRETCGDIDILITHPDGQSHEGVFPPLLKRLHESGFLTDDLVQEETNGRQKKYMGVCKLPSKTVGEGDEDARARGVHRRVDIIIVPFEEWACARLYFTGSAIFNRSMRALAIKKGMSLSEHALKSGVIRDGQKVKVHEGTTLPTPDEQSVFRHLGIPYRPPEDREHGKNNLLDIRSLASVNVL